MTTAAAANLTLAEGAVVGERELAFMRRALVAAEEAAGRGEVPVGAVVVVGDRVLALRRAAAALGSWRLTDADLFVTMEPCPMCAGALVNARVRRLYFGCDDPKAGAVRTLYNLVEDARLNHRVEVVPGVLAAEGAQLLRAFFSRLRQPQSRSAT
jgi:tRNA(adenine34) deaminase